MTIKKFGPLRSLFLGDSYTAGTAVPKDLRWPDQLVQRIRDCGIEADDPLLVAGNGWTTMDLRQALAAQELIPGYDLAFLLIGVNNQFFDHPFQVFAPEYEQLLRREIELCSRGAWGVFGVSIPDYSVTPFASDRDPGRIRREINRYNAACKESCARLGVSFLDTVQISRRARKDPSLLVEDALHPSEKMYQLWSESIFDSIREPLGQLRNLG